MSNSVIGALRVMLGMDTAEFESGATRAQRSAQRFEKDMQKLGGNLQRVGIGMSAALTAPLVAFGVASVQAAKESADALGQVRAGLESMGNASGRTVEQLQALAETQMGQSLFDDDQILREVSANLLTFGQVAGAEFDRAQQAALDLSTRLGTDLTSATLQIGKALNDPVKGVTALGRAGIQFSADQKAMIASLVETGDVAAAQRIILAELEKQFGGAALAAREADPGAALKQSFAAFQEEVGAKLLPLLPPLLGALTSILDAFTALPAPVQEGVLVFAGVAAALGPVLTALGSLVTIAPALVKAFGAIRVAATFLMAHPVILAFAGVLAGIYFAWQNWDKIEPIVRNLYIGVKTWLQDKLGAVFDWVRDKIKAVTGFFFDMYDAVVGNSYVPDMVEEIGAEFAKLQTLMVDPAQKATESVTEATRTMAGEVAGLLDRLFPQFAEARRQAEDLALLDKAGAKGLISDDLRRRARLKVLGSGEKAAVSDDLLRTGPLVDFGAKVDELQDELASLAKASEVQTVRIAETFRDMAQNAIRSLDDMVNAIRGGGFLDILGSVINFGLQLGGMGVFGKKVQANLQKTPGFANGGTMRLGGFAGIDRNVLSLNGSPIARVSAGETMQIRPANDGGRGATVPVHVTVGIDPSNGNVTAYIDQRVGTFAPAIAGAGAAMAQAQATSSARRRVR